MNVLILTVSTGGGHGRAAEAIEEMIKDFFPDSKTMIVDTYKYINPFIDKLVVGSYLKTVKKSPSLYGKLYKLSEKGDNIYGLSKTVNMFLSSGMEELIQNFEPAVIVCTHLFPVQMVSALKKKKKTAVPLVAVITDYVTHSLWIQEHVDAYIVAHSYMKTELIKMGAGENSVHVLGIPISRAFKEKKSRNSIIKELSLHDMFTVLLMGGSLGIGELESTFKALLECKRDMQIIVVTGFNLKLKNKLELISRNSTKEVKILSYTERIPDLMDISDVIITKPGGMTISEALAKELPIFIISPIPGQEEGNSRFLVNSGVAAWINTGKDMESFLHLLLDNPIRIRHMKEMARYLAKPDSSFDIAKLLGLLANKALL